MREPIYNSAGEVLYPGLAGDGAGYRGSRLVTLTPEGWEEAEGTWPLMQAAPVPEAKTGYVALGSYPGSYGAAAQEAALGGEGDLPRAPIEEAHAHILFHLGELPAQRGLGDVKDVRGSGNGLFPRHGKKIT